MRQTLGVHEFTVEDSAFGFIKMKNGATIILESAWAINSLEVDEAKCSLSGTKAGADMKDGLRIHGEDMGTLYTKHVELENKGVDFYEGNEVDEAEEEAKAWIDAVVNDTEPVVKPEYGKEAHHDKIKSWCDRCWWYCTRPSYSSIAETQRHSLISCSTRY